MRTNAPHVLPLSEKKMLNGKWRFAPPIGQSAHFSALMSSPRKIWRWQISVYVSVNESTVISICHHQIHSWRVQIQSSPKSAETRLASKLEYSTDPEIGCTVLFFCLFSHLALQISFTVKAFHFKVFFSSFTADVKRRWTFD